MNTPADKPAILAYTQVGDYTSYPAYMNIETLANGDVKVTVRSKEAETASYIVIPAVDVNFRVVEKNVASIATIESEDRTPLSVKDITEYIDILAWKLNGEHIHELTQAAKMIKSLAPIPKGIYYNTYSKKFYELDCTGPEFAYVRVMDETFHHQWFMRLEEFPRVPPP